MRLSRPVAEEDEDVTTFWLITYSDMVTLLLAFFLLMYSFTLLDEQRQEELVRTLNVVARGVGKQAAGEDLEARAREIAAQFGSESWVEATEHEVTVGLPSAVTFAPGSATLSPAGVDALHGIARILTSVPNTVRVEGHTDAVPIATAAFPSNWHLSAARAQSMVRLMIEQGVDPRRVQVVGFGDTRPRASNESEEGRRVNRRIEVKLVRAEGE